MALNTLKINTYLKPEANAGETLCRSPSAAHHSAWQCGWYIKQQLFGLGAKKTASFCFFTSLSANQKKAKAMREGLCG
ncbi:hypothetical protein QYS49_39385 [Marivirga salinae]|uniref:Uncharacterized protein n=1 Tax=Marivirga salinarum TaxID=3059078 RepID=A0AA51NAC5_9BACT|nr:hypothetical protein [Marivirga sp. BDSF4-3]WMN11722.1 hypothetical protein QYS49_39385 [Marivirga sp. BDSF4-3]